MLVLAKFVPGINTLAPPLAGSMNMRFVQFFALILLAHRCMRSSGAVWDSFSAISLPP